jgi:hypothetical protein
MKEEEKVHDADFNNMEHTPETCAEESMDNHRGDI